MSQVDLYLCTFDPEMDGQLAHIDFDYAPPESPSGFYPGASARAYINSISVNGECVMARVLDELDGIEDQVLNRIETDWRISEEERQVAEYELERI